MLIHKLRDIEILGWYPAGSVLTSWGKGASLVLAGHPSNDGVTIKMSYGLDVILHRPAWYPSFPIWLVKTESDFIVISVATGLGR